MLETCLRAVGESRGGADTVSVCFDEEVTHDHRELAERFPWAEFYRSEPHSNGPYVGRERFIRSGATQIVVFQDSDDAPTFVEEGSVTSTVARIRRRPHRISRASRE